MSQNCFYLHNFVIMTTSDLYTLELEYSPEKENTVAIKTIKTALETWKEKYGPSYVNYIERTRVIGRFFWLVSVVTKDLMVTLPEELMRQTLWVIGKRDLFDKQKLNYEVTLLL